MKTAFIPQVRVEPELRAELDALLHDGETLSSFIETSVRNAATFRRTQMGFHERGESAWQSHLATGSSVSAEDVMAKLQAKLDAKATQLRG